MVTRKSQESWHPLLKSYPESERVNKCSIGAETLFTRLLARADDLGDYYGDSVLLASSLYGHRIAAKQVSFDDVVAWKKELLDNNLIDMYTINDVEYAHIRNVVRNDGMRGARDIRFPIYPEIEKKYGAQLAIAEQREKMRAVSSRIIDHINLVTGRNFTYEDNTIKEILSRLMAGATEQECVLIVDFKASTWLGDVKMEDYVNPITLFRKCHFDSYLAAAKYWEKCGRKSNNRNKITVAPKDDRYNNLEA